MPPPLPILTRLKLDHPAADQIGFGGAITAPLSIHRTALLRHPHQLGLCASSADGPHHRGEGGEVHSPVSVAGVMASRAVAVQQRLDVLDVTKARRATRVCRVAATDHDGRRGRRPARPITASEGENRKCRSGDERSQLHNDRQRMNVPSKKWSTMFVEIAPEFNRCEG